MHAVTARRRRRWAHTSETEQTAPPVVGSVSPIHRNEIPLSTTHKYSQHGCGLPAYGGPSGPAAGRAPDHVVPPKPRRYLGVCSQAGTSTHILYGIRFKHSVLAASLCRRRPGALGGRPLPGSTKAAHTAGRSERRYFPLCISGHNVLCAAVRVSG